MTITKYHRHSTSCSTFFTGIDKWKTRWSGQKTNRRGTHIEVDLHEMVKQSSQSVNSLPFNVDSVHNYLKFGFQ